MDLTWLSYPLVAGALSGLGAALLVDYANFRSWQTWSDAKTYSWGTASMRWLQGAVGGLVTALGIQGVS